MQCMIYACGLNSHGQLSGETLKDHPADLTQFSQIIAGDAIRVLFAGWSATLFDIDGQLRLYGSSTDFVEKPFLPEIDSSNVVSGFGDHTGLLGILDTHGDILLLDSSGEEYLTFKPLRDKVLVGEEPAPLPHVRHIAIAGNGKVCISGGDAEVLEYPSFTAFTSSLQSSATTEPKRHVLAAPPTNLLASETAFVAVLARQNLVYTFGDGRHNHLGRIPSQDSPSSEACLVDDLGGIPIKIVATGGWVSAVVTASMELLVWGGRPGGPHRSLYLQPSATSVHVSKDAALDTVDVAVGDGHVMVLDAKQGMWALGRNGNGQLGLGSQSESFLDTWTKIPLHIDAEYTPRQLICGPRSSLMLAEKKPAA